MYCPQGTWYTRENTKQCSSWKKFYLNTIKITVKRSIWHCLHKTLPSWPAVAGWRDTEVGWKPAEWSGHGDHWQGV